MPVSSEWVADITSQNISKVLIIDALCDLLAAHSLKDITVEDICEQAGVSRRTFYRHFESKYAVAQWCWQQSSWRYILRVGRDLNWHDSLTLGFKQAEPYLMFFIEASKDGGYESCQEYGCRLRKQTLRETVVDYCHVSLTEELEFQIDFFADAEAVAVRTCMTNERDFNPERFAELLELCVPQELHDLLDAPTKILP